MYPSGASIEPGSGPGVEGGAGIKGVIKGPSTPGGISTAGVNGNGMPDVPWSIWLAGIAGIHGSNVEGFACPGTTPAGVGPSPIAGGCPSAAGTNGGALLAPGIRGVRSVDEDC